MEHSLPYLRESLLFLGLAGILIPLLQRWRVNQVIGFLVAGVLLGPHGSGSLVGQVPALAWVTFPREEGVNALAELGVIFLMFLIGLELSMRRVWELRRWVLGAGVAQVLLSAVAIGGIAFAFGNRWPVAVVLGLVLSLSSTAVVMQLLADSRKLATPAGQASFSVLMLQDLAVVPLLILVQLIGSASGMTLLRALGTQTAVAAAVVAAILLAGPRLVAPLFHTFARQRQPEVFTALCLLVVLSIGGLTAAAGLSMALGAFLAGLLLAETEYRHEVEVTIEPFKGLLMGLFFMSVGMGIDPRAVLRDPGWLLASVAGLLLIKSAIAAGVLRVAGLRWRQALEAGTLLGQGGEFAFVVVGAAMAAQVLDAATGQFMLLVVSLSLLATPLFARMGARVAAIVDRASLAPSPAQDHEPPPAQGRVVVIGFGRVGRMLGEVCDRQGIGYVAVEQDHDAVGRLRREGFPVFYGNAARAEFLRKLELEQAVGLVVTTDSPQAARRIVQAAREQAPALPIFARSHDEAHARELEAAGATRVVPEMLEAGLVLTAQVLAATGLEAAGVEDVIAAERTRRVGGA